VHRTPIAEKMSARSIQYAMLIWKLRTTTPEMSRCSMSDVRTCRCGERIRETEIKHANPAYPGNWFHIESETFTCPSLGAPHEAFPAPMIPMTAERIGVLAAIAKGMCQKWAGIVPRNAVVLGEMLAEVGKQR
jgi:hypothetical protein